MRTYQVHLEPAADGSLPPEGWRKARAASESGAVAVALRADKARRRPAVAYVALGLARHENGAPVVVQSFRLAWDFRNQGAGI